MGKKIDLNSPRTNTSGSHNRRVNHLFSHSTPNKNQTEINDNTSSNNKTNNQSTVKQKGMETGLRAAGVPKGIAKGLAENEKTYELADKLTATIKFPIKAKVTVIAAFIMIPFFALMMFVVLFSDASAAGAGSGALALVEKCRTVTVTNTDCDENDNCKNTYSGEVNFEDYIAGVLAAKKLETDNVEYYKAIAIETRTKVLNTLSSSCQIEGNEEFLPYIDVEESIYKSIITEAVNETSGIVITSSDLIYIINEDKINYEESIKLINEENYTYKDIINKYYGKENEEISLTDANRINISKTVDGFINPLTTGHCTSPFGYRDLDGDGYNEGHTGLDIGGNAAGTPIYATKNGTVVAVVKHVPGFSTVESCGNYVTIDHGDGTKTSYCHMLYGSIPTWVVSGAAVEQGEKIGEVGNTGHSYGAHLHYMVRLNGELQDPVDYVDTSAFGGTCKQ